MSINVGKVPGPNDFWSGLKWMPDGSCSKRCLTDWAMRQTRADRRTWQRDEPTPFWWKVLRHSGGVMTESRRDCVIRNEVSSQYKPNWTGIQLGKRFYTLFYRGKRVGLVGGCWVSQGRAKGATPSTTVWGPGPSESPEPFAQWRKCSRERSPKANPAPRKMVKKSKEWHEF